MAKKYFSLQKRQEIVKNGQNVKNSPKLAKIAINEIFCRYGKMNQFQRKLKQAIKTTSTFNIRWVKLQTPSHIPVTCIVFIMVRLIVDF